MAKCHCGLELVTKLKATVVREHDAPDLEKIRVCPDHGEDWRLSQEQVAALVRAVKLTDHWHEAMGPVPPAVNAEAWDKMREIERVALAGLPKAP